MGKAALAEGTGILGLGPLENAGRAKDVLARGQAGHFQLWILLRRG